VTPEAALEYQNAQRRLLCTRQSTPPGKQSLQLGCRLQNHTAKRRLETELQRACSLRLLFIVEVAASVAAAEASALAATNNSGRRKWFENWQHALRRRPTAPGNSISAMAATMQRQAFAVPN